MDNEIFDRETLLQIIYETSSSLEKLKEQNPVDVSEVGFLEHELFQWVTLYEMRGFSPDNGE